MSIALKTVHSRLKDLATRKSEFDPTIGLYRLRLPVPLVRRSMRPYYPFVSDSYEKNLRSWTEVWTSSNLFEAKSQALYFYQYKSLTNQEFEVIAGWVDYCTCWEHSDDLSKIIAQVTEDNPRWSVPILRKWVRAKSSWHRRQSLIGLMEYARKRKTYLPFETYIKNIDSLLGDTDYYVQKAIGWALREVYNVYPEKCFNYQKENISSISPLAYSAATAKLNVRDKALLNQLRKLR